MICAKSVLPRLMRYATRKTRSVHESNHAVQIGDTPNGVVRPINRGL